MPSELVSVGRGGQLTVAFAQPVYDDPRNAFGVDLIVYGNAFFSDLAHPGGYAGFLFSEGGNIQVSADGVTWHGVSGEADGSLPTMAFMDAGPYQEPAGEQLCDPALPVDPGVSGDDVIGLSYPELQAVYAGACGGTRIDLAEAGLAHVKFIRITVAANAPSVPEVDAFVAVRHEYAPADLNGDGTVDGADLGTLLGAWGGASFADLDGSGLVDGADLGILLGAWS